ncbi:hypothetical protein AAGQ96_14560 [Pantoea sp. MBD-2R]|uniref:hypothetical protein n=1 Tax=Pantoea sp. MBD-2R TaxID=3141540 RepID=UPI0031839A2F
MLKKMIGAMLLSLVLTGTALGGSDTATDARIDSLMGQGTHQQYHQFLTDLQQAVAKGDKHAVAGMVSYPITVTVNQKKRKINTPRAFIQIYDRVFTPSYRKSIVDQQYADVFARDMGIMVGEHGELWYSGICHSQDCSKFTIKVIAINN